VSINSGFGGVHAAILNLAAKYLGSQWIEDVKPQTDAEMLDANVYPAGGSNID
jgi:nuclear pore complex protein Nup205